MSGDEQNLHSLKFHFIMKGEGQHE
ncbi:Protein of unknown function [Bacillus mycoides]|uniref:Uncharacterized protein n=1 Tax=Bacillus mycoides TaxID=1405 RepID=A0A1C4E9L5_BACMY|nr:Protein of unknown function [Bacillus mycoides]SCC40230.1 Protein of unknown function [Bacillus mycoides]SCM87691.1 Protein of unknown function [Bacillus mycoides]SCM95797.1 Protein of unknown function [Bacillus mycoides]